MPTKLYQLPDGTFQPIEYGEGQEAAVKAWAAQKFPNAQEYSPPEGPRGVMAPPLTGGQSAVDYGKAGASSVPSGYANTVAGVFNLPNVISHAFNALTGGQQGPAMKRYEQAVEDTRQELQHGLGGDYEPKQVGSDILKSAGEGLTSTMLTGGRSALDAALGVLSGAGSNVAQRAGAGPVGATAAGALPFAGASVLGAFNPAGKVYSTGRSDLARTSPGEAAFADRLQGSAQANQVPAMAWQTYPPSSAMYRRGAGATTSEYGEGPQAQLSKLQGGDYDPTDPTLHEQAGRLEVGARLKAAGTPNALQGTPGDATDLAAALRRSDQLRNADVSAGPLRQAPVEESGTAAIALHAIPDSALQHALGALEFARMGALRKLLFKPAVKSAAEDLYTAPTTEAFRDVASRNPQRDALRRVLQAYTTPAGGNIYPQPGP